MLKSLRDSNFVGNKYQFKLRKSNCRILNQPLWANVEIWRNNGASARIDATKLLLVLLTSDTAATMRKEFLFLTKSLPFFQIILLLEINF